MSSGDSLSDEEEESLLSLSIPSSCRPLLEAMIAVDVFRPNETCHSAMLSISAREGYMPEVKSFPKCLPVSKDNLLNKLN